MSANRSLVVEAAVIANIVKNLVRVNPEFEVIGKRFVYDSDQAVPDIPAPT
jgi:acyl-CoA synthetase (NDP forming)